MFQTTDPPAPPSLEAVGCTQASAASQAWSPSPRAGENVSPGVPGPNPNLVLLLLQRPPHLHTKPSQAPAVEVTPAGASYNPSFEDHQVHSLAGPLLSRHQARGLACPCQAPFLHPLRAGDSSGPREPRACPPGAHGPVGETDLFPDSDNPEWAGLGWGVREGFLEEGATELRLRSLLWREGNGSPGRGTACAEAPRCVRLASLGNFTGRRCKRT